MDGDPVTEGEPSIEYSTFTEVFMKLCPYYMEMGMSYHDFWNMNTSCHKAYREAYEIRKHNEEWARHRQGAYFFHALMCVAPIIKAFSKAREPGKYPEEPWPLTHEEAERREELKRNARLSRLLAVLNKESEIAKQQQGEAKENG